MDDTSNDIGFRADIMLISPEGHKIHCALPFGYKVSNNKVEYETLIEGLCLAKELQAFSIQIYNDAQLMVNHVNDIYQARVDRMAAYLEKAKGLMDTFPVTSIEVTS